MIRAGFQLGQQFGMIFSQRFPRERFLITHFDRIIQVEINNKKLFSQNSKKDIEDINKQISSFFEFIDGDIQEYSGDCASSSENNNGNKRIELDGMYHISTSKNEYYLNFYMVYKADDVPSDIGLSKIEIATEQTVNRENFMWDTSENGIFVVRE